MENLDAKISKRKVVVSVVIQCVFYIAALYFFDIAKDYYSDDCGYKFHFDECKYVGGDAYNYIITAARSTALMVKSLIWVILGCCSVLIGRTFRVR